MAALVPNDAAARTTLAVMLPAVSLLSTPTAACVGSANGLLGAAVPHVSRLQEVGDEVAAGADDRVAGFGAGAGLERVTRQVGTRSAAVVVVVLLGADEGRVLLVLPGWGQFAERWSASCDLHFQQ